MIDPTLTEREYDGDASFEKRYLGLSDEQICKNETANKCSSRYLDLPVKNWPDFELKWSLNVEEYKFAIDGRSRNSFMENYPDGLKLVWVEHQELYKKFPPHCQHPKDDPWSMCTKDKLAKVICYWVGENAMTPPLICFHKNLLNIGGGHHRLAVCAVKNPEIIPILVIPSEEDRIKSILNL